jgi:anti-anti-sigma factor
MEERHLQIAASLELVVQACEFVYQAALDAGMDEHGAHHCYLAVDEACTNVIEHGYGENIAQQAIDLVCRKVDNTFLVVVLDDGPVFNPLNVPDPNPGISMNEREPGGWGIFFIKKLMHEVTYDRDGVRNRLTMVKRIESSSDVTPPPASVKAAPVNNKVWQIALSGWINASQTIVLERALNDHLTAGHKYLILDMSHVEYIASSGVKILVGAWQRARENKGNLVLVGMKPRIFEILQLIGLDLVFPIAETQAQAVAFLTAKYLR